MFQGKLDQPGDHWYAFKRIDICSMGGKEIWGASEKFYHGAEKTLRDQPMTMNEIKTSLPGNFKQMKKQEEQEKRELQSCEPA